MNHKTSIRVGTLLFLCLSIFFPALGKTSRPVFRPNPYLRSHENSTNNTEKKQARKKPDIVISSAAKKRFCLNVRGWAVPTVHVFSVLEGVLKKDKLTEEDIKIFRFWLDRGFGYALGTLIEDVNQKHIPKFQSMINSEYKNTNVICPFSCTYKDYVELQDQLSAENKKILYKLCQPKCDLQRNLFTSYDKSFCECLVDINHTQCEFLTSEDFKMIKSANKTQDVSRRDYEFRTKKNFFNSENVEAIEQSKSEMVKAINSMIFR